MTDETRHDMRMDVIQKILKTEPHTFRRRDLIHWASHLPGFDHMDLPEAAWHVRRCLWHLVAEGTLVEDARGCIVGHAALMDDQAANREGRGLPRKRVQMALPGGGP